ncbi:hypothetical protein E3N88_24996 [Mikania micrantha]|uniref:Uncharacterized protein n=1 Tax=Mikania micrantha TaxID=192012 RepID=A0A5N6N6D5_9ASTR|nr:hypothetical protein E3N88_24996 [Mikania micrantha]
MFNLAPLLNRCRKAGSSEDGRRIRSRKAGTRKHSEGRKHAMVGDFTAEHWSEAAKKGGRREAVDSWRAARRESTLRPRILGFWGD